MDRWQSLPIVCSGGQIEDQGLLEQGSALEGTATLLQNYESALEGGYKRILGFTKWDTNIVPGLTSAPVRGVHVALGGVFAARENTGSTSTDVFFSTGSGWGTKINTANQAVATGKVRMHSFSISKEVVVITDGQGPALHYDGTTDTLINGLGAPTTPKYATEHKNRLVLAPASNDSSIAISAPNQETNFDGLDGAIEINVGDKIMGLQKFRETLYIFCERSIYSLDGNTSQDFQINTITRDIGTVSGDTIQEVGGDVIFLAPDGLRSLAATVRLDDVELALQSRAIQPTVRTLVGRFTEDEYNSVVVGSKSQYRLFVNDSSTDEANQLGLIGRINNTLQGNLGYEWSTTRGIYVFSSHGAYNAANEIIVHGHPTDGFVYQQEVGNTFGLNAGAVNISAVYTSPHITFKDTDIRKVLQKMKLHTQVDGDIAINLGTLIDFGGINIPQPSTQVITQTGAVATYGSAGTVYGTAVYSALQFPVFKINLIGSGFTFQFSFTSADANPPHRIDAFTVLFGPKNRR